MNILQTIEKKMMPAEKKINFNVGDTVKVHYKIIEGNKERIQVYEGVVIAIGNKGINKAFTVRKISFDIGVERVFPLFSPRIAKIDVIRKGKARRAKLYYLRERTGKSTKLKEKRITAGSAPDSAPQNTAPSAEEISQKPGE
jgi:large subunit ribosomal protein L19